MNFNPYHQWLGMDPRLKNPHYFQLLGVSAKVEDPQQFQRQVTAAAKAKLELLKQVEPGEQAPLLEALRRRVVQAQQVLVNDQLRAKYIAKLKQGTVAIKQLGAARGNPAAKEITTKEIPAKAPTTAPPVGATTSPVGATTPPNNVTTPGPVPPASPAVPVAPSVAESTAATPPVPPVAVPPVAAPPVAAPPVAVTPAAIPMAVPILQTPQPSPVIAPNAPGWPAQELGGGAVSRGNWVQLKRIFRFVCVLFPKGKSHGWPKCLLRRSLWR